MCGCQLQRLEPSRGLITWTEPQLHVGRKLGGDRANIGAAKLTHTPKAAL